MDIPYIQATNLILQGHPICFPTETVYALACDAANDLAVERIYHLKGRSAHAPLAVMAKDLQMAQEYGIFNETALALAQRFWPGPLTIIVPKRKNPPLLSPLINMGLDTIGFRIPKHPTALQLLETLNKPLVATSVNPSTKPSATTASQIRTYFGDKLYIIEEGECTLGIESTIIDTSVEPAQIIREGSLPRAELKSLLQT